MSTPALNTAEFAKQKAMMEAPERWPRWPLLPVKRPRGDGLFPDTGVMVAIEGRRLHVYHNANLWGFKVGQPLGPQLDALDSTVYGDYEAILNAGWVVD